MPARTARMRRKKRRRRRGECIRGQSMDSGIAPPPRYHFLLSQFVTTLAKFHSRVWLIVETIKLETRLCAVMWPTSWCSANAKLFKNGAREERALPRQNGEASASDFLRLPKTLREILDS